MKEQLLSVLLAAGVGSIFTLITQGVVLNLRRDRIKKTVDSYLLDIINPKIDRLKEELVVLLGEIEKEPSEGVALGMHPTFNSTVIKSFPMSDLHAIYNDKFNSIINIIGYLDNLSWRIPHSMFKSYITEIQNHVDSHFELNKDIYPTRKDHFFNCPAVLAIRNNYSANTKNVEKILDDLRSNLLLVTKS